MNTNLLTRAIDKIKSNQKPSTVSKKSEEAKPASGDILSRIKKSYVHTELLFKDPVGGRELRQQKRSPYPAAGLQNLKRALGGRFVPKSELINQPWKHDLCPVQDRPKHRVFIRGLPKDVSSDTLKQTFTKYGEIVGVHIEGETADIYFATKYSAQKAANEDNQIIIRGKKIKVSFSEDQGGVQPKESAEEKIPEKTLEADKAKGPQSILSRIKKPNQ